jgi:hypothetical protein
MEEEKGMGVNDREQDKKDDRRKASLAKRKVGGRTAKGAAPADWEAVDGVLLSKLVAAATRDGGALRLGYTRDGGAYAIGVYGDGDPYTLYVSPSEDINEWIREATADFKA